MKINKVLLILVVLNSSFAFSGTFSGKIQKIDIHAQNWSGYNPNDLGFMSLYIEGMPKSCNQPNGMNRVVITTDHPLYDSALSVAIAAKMADKSVYVHYLETCNLRSGAWDFGYISLR